VSLLFPFHNRSSFVTNYSFKLAPCKSVALNNVVFRCRENRCLCRPGTLLIRRIQEIGANIFYRVQVKMTVNLNRQVESLNKTAICMQGDHIKHINKIIIEYKQLTCSILSMEVGGFFWGSEGRLWLDQ
jgi:hypothetical protein